MSLRHAILGALSAAPLSGYDLVQYFNDSLGYVWSAPKSQIYPELRKMEERGLVNATVAPRGLHAQKRIYAITEDGASELHRWASNRMEYPPDRDAFRLKAIFFDAAPFEAAREQLRAHIAHYAKRQAQWEERAASLRARRNQMLRRRLTKRAPEEHDTIIELKAFAFEGNVGRAKAEIAWAERGLKLLDELETRRTRTGARKGGAIRS